MANLIGYKDRLWKVIHDFKCVNAGQAFALNAGTYLFICKGGAGGKNDDTTINERGGTSYGVITLNDVTSFHAIVGGNGGDAGSEPGEGGFNGGANGGLSASSSYVCGAGGGGASDIRLLAYAKNEYPTYDENHQFVDPAAEKTVLYDIGYNGEDTVALPTGHTAYEYLEVSNVSSGSRRCLDSQYIPKTTTRIVVDCELYANNTSAVGTFFGTDNNGNGAYFAFRIRSDSVWKPSFRVNGFDIGGSTENISVGNGHRLLIDVDARGKMSIDDLTTNDRLWEETSTTGMTMDCTNPILFYDINRPNSGTKLSDTVWADSYEFTSGKIYDIKIYEKDVLVCHMIPAIRESDGYCGMYDIKRDLFLPMGTKQSSITCTAYDPLAHTYHALEYIQSTGYYGLNGLNASQGSYFNTLYIPKPNTKVVFDGTIVNRIDGEYTAIFNTRARYTGSHERSFEFYTNILSTPTAQYFRDTMNETSTEFIYNNRIKLECYRNKAEWFLNGVSKGSITLPDTTYRDCLYPMLINSTNDGGTVVSEPGTMQLYRFTIFEKTDAAELPIRDYIPARRMSDNIVGLFDNVAHVFIVPSIASWIGGPVVTKHPSLDSRIMVAGGGGGSYMNNESSYPFHTGGSSGGGISGDWHSSENIMRYEPNYNICANQTTGYAFGYASQPTVRSRVHQNSSMGASGGGGGWFGGLTSGNNYLRTTNQSLSGGGGSGYVLTSTSYKPDGYNPSSKYYFSDVTMIAGSSTEGEVIIAQLTSGYSTGDTIEFPCVGDGTKVTLIPGQYTLKCYGGDGGYRYNYQMAKRGGYSEGTLSLTNVTDAFIHVGGSSFPRWNVDIGNGIITTVSRDATAVNYPTISYNGGGTPAVVENNVNLTSGGGGTDIRLIEDDLYHRVIVAGGAGSQGTSSRAAGAGGGLTGEDCAQYNGYTNGPGTQQQSPNTTYASVAGAFGVGGSGYHPYSSAYGGSGGGGWFGGSGTYPDRNNDSISGGSGGSGYVLTNTSYKPDGYALDEQYYLTNALTSTGGNNLPLFQTKAIIEVNRVTTPMICYDKDGYKYFSMDTMQWELMTPQPDTLTKMIFDRYPDSFFINDTGLASTYDIYVYDENNSIDSVVMDVVPPRQTISCTLEMHRMISNVIPDVEDYDTSKFNVVCPPATRVDDEHTAINISVDKLVTGPHELKVYSAQVQTRGSMGPYRYINPDGKRDYYTYNKDTKEIEHDRRKFELRNPEKFRDDSGQISKAQWLLPVGKTNQIPLEYRNILDEGVTDICDSMFAELDRLIYIAMLVRFNNTDAESYLIIKALNFMTGELSDLCKIKWNLINHYSPLYLNLGGFLVDDNYYWIAYQSGITLRDGVVRIDRDTLNITRLPNTSAILQGWGRLHWYDSRSILASTSYKLELYDTTENRWSTLVTTPIQSVYDFVIGNKYIMYSNYEYSRMVYTVDRKTLETKSYQLPAYAYQTPLCYHDGKFYIIQKNYIYEFDEETETLSDPIVASIISTPMSVEYTNGALMIHQYDSRQLIVYQLDTQTYTVVYLPWQTYGGRYYWYWSNNRANYGIYHPFSLKGYYFLLHQTLAMINYSGSSKYNMGHKFNQYIAYFNEENIDQLSYDDRFVKVTKSNIVVSDGSIEFEVGEYNSNHIAKTRVTKKQYKYINLVYVHNKDS